MENCTLSDQNRRRARGLGVLSEVRRICDVIFNEFDSPCTDKDEMKAWHDETGDGEVGAAKCLLLTLLPNVDQISIGELDRFGEEMSGLIYRSPNPNEKVSSLF